MGASGYAKVLLAACGDPTSKITEATLAAMIHKLGWTVPGKDRLAKIRLTTGCSDVIAMAAFHIHHLFNHAHSEFKMTADWLVRSVTEVAACGRNAGMASRRLERMRTSEAAPDPTKIHLSIDSSLTGLPSVRVQCGPWPATVCWREPALRDYVSSRGAQRGLTILKGSGQVKPFTPQLAIENVTQAAARNALCAGLLTLKQNHGIVDALHVHDEVLLIVDRTREAVLKAKEILVSVFGPTNSHPMDWAVLIKPDEISVTESLWEDEVDIMKPVRDEKTGVVKGGDRWGRIERDDPGCFDCLP